MDPEVSKDGEVVLRQVGRELHANTVIGALTACLSMGSDPMSYGELMGWSGAAFRFQIRQPEWDARATHGTVGFDCLQCAAEQLGRSIRRVHAEDRTMAVRIQVDQGRLLIHDQEQAGVVIGYRADGEEVLIRTFDGSDDSWQAIRDWTWDTLYVVGSAPKSPPPLRVRFTRAIERAVHLLDGEEIPDPESGYYWYQSGCEGIRVWAAQLQDENAFAVLDPDGMRIARAANAAMARTLVDARGAAVLFERRYVTTLGSSAERHLLQASALLDRSAELAVKAASLAPEPNADSIWGQETRSEQAALLSQVASSDTEAIVELRSALAASGMSAPLV